MLPWFTVSDGRGNLGSQKNDMKNLIYALKLLFVFVLSQAFGFILLTPPSALWLLIVLFLFVLWIAALRISPETETALRAGEATIEKNHPSSPAAWKVPSFDQSTAGITSVDS